MNISFAFKKFVILVSVCAIAALAVLGGQTVLIDFQTGSTSVQRVERLSAAKTELVIANQKLQILKNDLKITLQNNEALIAANETLSIANTGLVAATSKLVGANSLVLAAFEKEAAKGPLDKLISNAQMKEHARAASEKAIKMKNTAIDNAEKLRAAVAPAATKAVDTAKAWHEAVSDRIASML
jgi:hypothetical protein